MSKKIKRIGVFTSGGDAPGMNAALRSVVRSAAHFDMEVYGIQSGYEGMIDGNIAPLEVRAVGNILQRGGTFLKTARSERFLTEAGRKKAATSLNRHKIEGCIALGGNGTFTGADLLHREHGIPIIGVPCTIDNDLYGTDFSIGFDTAVNTAVEAVDKIRDTAESHDRVFFIEVMGRKSGYLALYTAIASGAGHVIIPEKETNLDDLVQGLQKSSRSGKLFSLIIVAEGNPIGTAEEIAAKVSSRLKSFDTRVTIIGHLQRGGSPSGNDRVLAGRLGYAAVEALCDGMKSAMVGMVNGQIKHTSLGIAIKNHKEVNLELIRLAETLAL